MDVPFSRPYYPGGEAEALGAVIASRWVTQGPRVAEFERAFAARVGAEHAVATANGTLSLQLALHAVGVGPGDEVVVPSLSFIATANAAWQLGATPVFADVEPETYNLDPRSAEAAVTERTVAIMPVHQIGLAADMDAFRDLAARRGLVLVEDAAPALGARYHGAAVGSLGPLSCFSLHARKVITTGEGGMITTNDAELAERLRRLRHHGMNLSDLARHQATDIVFEEYAERGWNARLTDLQAALGLCQLEALDDILAARRRLAERYHRLLAELPHVSTPVEPDGHVHSWQSYAIRLDPAAGIDRTDVMRAMLAAGVATRRGVTAIHREPAYAGAVEPGALPCTEAAADETMLLPLFPELTDAQQDHVVETLSAALLARVA